jgi:hypothetical protein
MDFTLLVVKHKANFIMNQNLCRSRGIGAGGQIVNGLYKKHKSCGSAFADFIYIFCKVCQLSFVSIIPIEYHRKNLARVYAGY